ncbi:MAG: Ig-like domain-containing protein [Oscillospiraceae bacterium]|nr:Ig-like domain-containing protein [Oscillospiraceae bacterium]
MILALALIISLVPSVFADDTETETDMEYSGITVKYNFAKSAGYDFNADGSEFKSNIKEVKFNNTSGFWEYYSALSLDQKTPRAVSVKNGYSLYFNAFVGDWFALAINVPKNGRYDLSFGHHERKTGDSGAQSAGVWILPLINPSTGEKYTDNEISETLEELDPKTTNLNFLSPTGSTLSSESYCDGGFYDFPEAGTYLVIYKALKDTAGNAKTKEEGGSNARLYPGTITLDGVNGEGENIIPFVLDTSVDNTTLKVGETTTAEVSATAYMSDGSAATEGYAVTYTSSDDNIATVDENGVVTAVGYGTATITASTTINGYTVSGTEEITVNADGVSIEYNVGELSTSIGNSPYNKSVRETTYDKTNGFYKFYDGNFDKNDTSIRHVRSKGSNDSGTGNLEIMSNRAVVYEVYIPMAGTYTMEMQNGVWDGTTSGKVVGDVKVFLSTVEEMEEGGGVYKNNSKDYSDIIESSLGEYVGKYSCFEEGKTNEFGQLASTPNKISGFVIPEAGYYAVAFYARECFGSVGDFTLTNGTGLDPVAMPAMIKLGADELEVGGTTTAEAIKYLSDGNPVATEDVEISAITSANADVVTVGEDGATITAVSVGTATLSATVTYSGNIETLTREVTVVGEVATEEVVDAEITFAATSNVGGDGITVTVPEIDYVIGQPNSDIPAGTSIALTATGVEGYEFRGWKRGSESDGVMISNAETFTFPLFTNTVITAIYEAKSETPTTPSVEFYNYNGQFIESKPVNGQVFSALKPAEKDNPTLTGHNFSFWTCDGKTAVGENEVFEVLTRVVAMFTVDTKTYAVDIGDGITGADDDSYAYDTKLELSASGKGTWYVNNKPVAYGDKYTHYVYGKANITFTAGEGSGAPILSLDTEEIDGSRMISYDANGAEIVEVGIIFGSGTPTIGSFNNGKAASKHTGKNISGQFTATGYDGTSTGARGYLIYNDNGTYRVIYAD